MHIKSFDVKSMHFIASLSLKRAQSKCNTKLEIKNIKTTPRPPPEDIKTK